MLVETVPALAFDENCFVVAPAAGEQCVIIDPGIGVGPGLDEVLGVHRLQPVAVLLTHGHLDHTCSVLPVCGAREIPAWIHPADRRQLADPMSGLNRAFAGLAAMLGDQLPAAEPADVRELADRDVLELAGLRLAVQHTPGHSPGSVTFGTADGGPDDGPVLFSGDVLFAGSIGRMDLPGGSEPEMAVTLRTKILAHPDGTTVHPGHGPSTTIGHERATNPYLREFATSGS